MRRVGTCSICGGDVMNPIDGAFYGTPPSLRCNKCGATSRPSTRIDVIPMVPHDPVDNTFGGSNESQQDYFGNNNKRKS